MLLWMAVSLLQLMWLLSTGTHLSKGRSTPWTAQLAEYSVQPDILKPLNAKNET